MKFLVLEWGRAKRMTRIKFPNAPVRFCAPLVAAALFIGHFQESSAVGATITGFLGSSAIDPSNNSVMITPISIKLDLDLHWRSFSITNVFWSTIPGQTMTLVYDPQYSATAGGIYRFLGSPNYFGPFPMGTIQQTLADGENLPLYIRGSLILTEYLSDNTVVTSSYDYTVGVWATPEPASFVSGAMAVLGVGGLLARRRWNRASA